MKITRKLRVVLLSLLLLVMLVPTHSQAAFNTKAPSVTVKKLINKVNLSWKTRKDLTGYEIYKTDVTGTEMKLLKRTKKTTYTVKNLTQGETYYFVVRGYKTKNGKKQYTDYCKKKKVILETYLHTSTIKKMLKAALQPVGSTVYIWGGGWNQEDVGANTQARTLGISPEWRAFYQKQNSKYNYKKYLYKNTKGLDCSGYVGWVMYNTFATENGAPGFVMFAQKMAKEFADRGWGTYVAAKKVKKRYAGDIMSSGGHVYIVVGTCSDGSVVLLHSSPPGVQLCGTSTPSGKMDSKAVALATQYMQKYYPDYYEKFPVCSRGTAYLTSYNQMQWDVSGNSVLTDPDGLRKLSAEKVLKKIFK